MEARRFRTYRALVFHACLHVRMSSGFHGFMCTAEASRLRRMVRRSKTSKFKGLTAVKSVCHELGWNMGRHVEEGKAKCGGKTAKKRCLDESDPCPSCGCVRKFKLFFWSGFQSFHACI